MRLILLTKAMLLLTASPLRAQLCATPPDSSDRFTIQERQLTAQGALRGIEHLRERIPGLLDSAASLEAVRRNAVFYIGYWNSLIRLEGYVLRLDATIAKAELDAAELALETGDASEQAVIEARRRFEAAQQALCVFLRSHRWVD